MLSSIGRGRRVALAEEPGTNYRLRVANVELRVKLWELEQEKEGRRCSDFVDDSSGDECQQQMFTNRRLELLAKCREDMRDGQEQPLLGKCREDMRCGQQEQDAEPKLVCENGACRVS